MSGPPKDGKPSPYFGEYPPDFFDFIVIDECHRGGANDESNWRDILNYFSPAVQLGLTATPKRRDNVDTYAYFGEPVFIYSLKEGINDGFLTPFKVKQISTTLDEYVYTPDDKVVEGELEVMDLKAAFHSAVRKLGALSVEEFSTWPQLNQFTVVRPGHAGGETIVKPDGYIRIHENEPDGHLSERVFFLEVDRSTEILDTIVSRAGSYLHYYASGGFAARNGASRSAYKDYPFRVLVAFKTAERRNNAAERLLQHTPPIFTLACLSTFEEVKGDPLGTIWIRPFDYRNAVRGTPFDPGHIGRQREYQRQTARDAFVELHVKKQSIITDDAPHGPS